MVSFYAWIRKAPTKVRLTTEARVSVMCFCTHRLAWHGYICSVSSFPPPPHALFLSCVVHLKKIFPVNQLTRLMDLLLVFGPRRFSRQLASNKSLLKPSTCPIKNCQATMRKPTIFHLIVSVITHCLRKLYKIKVYLLESLWVRERDGESLSTAGGPPALAPESHSCSGEW